MTSNKDARRVLLPFDPDEVISLPAAAARMGKSEATARCWGIKHALARKLDTQWAFSVVAVEMFVEGNTDALELYHAGDLTHPSVVAYYRRFNLAVPALMRRPSHGVGSAGSAGLEPVM